MPTARLGNHVRADRGRRASLGREMRTRRYPNERFLVLAGLGLASALCVALELFRERQYGDFGFRFLLWNLTLGWTGALAALALTSVGVYVGRFLQWNSWDLVFRPGQRLAEIAPGLGQPTALVHASAVTVLLTGLLALTYLAFYALVGLTVDPERYATR